MTTPYPHENLESTTKLPYLDELRSEGYEIGTVLRNSNRYIAYEVKKDGSRFFFKGINGVSPDKLKAEVWFSKLLNASQNGTVVAPEIIRAETDWYIAEFLDGTPLCPEAECFKTDLTQYIGAMSKILSLMDRLHVPERQPVRDKLDRIPVDKASRIAVEQGVISNDARTQALSSIVDRLKTGERRIQHDDFTPWHLFDLGQNKFGLIDSEHVGTRPRFTDLAGLYSRLFNRCNAPEVAAAVLLEFVSSNNLTTPDFMKQFGPVMINKALMGCYDATVDWVKHDYKNSSRELLERCLLKDLKALTSV